MKNRWTTTEARLDALDEAVLGSRALGAHADLVLHGGGNSSIKDRHRDVTGREIDVIHVKGSGWDLATIERAGFAPLRLDRLRELAALEHIPDPVLVNELRCALVDASSPDASIEALLHATLPHRAVLHSHADTIVALTNQPEPDLHVRRAFGDRVLVVPYVKPGFDLARAVATVWAEEGRDDLDGIVLANHGLFTFGDTMQQAYERHIDLLTAAEAHLEASGAPVPAAETVIEPRVLDRDQAIALADLRARASRASGRPLTATVSTSPAIERFLERDDLADVATRGPATPDHIIRTKQLPLVGTAAGADVEGYVEAYRAYFQRNEARSTEPVTELDPTPRAVYQPGIGLITLGKTIAEARQVRDIAAHTVDIIEAGERLGRYVALDEGSLFDIEYWDLEQAKLRRSGSAPALQGQTAFVTGAASGIGRGCVQSLLDLGANVVGIDISADVAEAFAGDRWLGLRVDVLDPAAIADALAAGVSSFGGIDIVIASAGVFAESTPIVDVSPTDWQRTIDINLTALRSTLAAAHPYLVHAAPYGRAVIVGSKNLAAPGPGASAYSASKAAATQLARVAALEWASDGIRVNVIHPDAVFDTGLWTDALLRDRAEKYGLTVDQYKRRNLLATEITSAGVGRMVAAICGEPFQATTGAQIPVDGGNERVI